MAENAKTLIEANGLQDVIEVIHSKIEDIPSDKIGKEIDVFVSEPLGTFLLNERMLETYIIARDKFLKPGGKMFPASAHFCILPFYDNDIYAEQMNKTNFWDNKNYNGIDLTCLKEKAVEEKFGQPLIDTFNPKKMYILII